MKRRVTLKFKLLILAVCLVYAAILYAQQSALLDGLNKEKAQLQKTFEQQAIVNAQLENHAQFSNSDAYIEKTAREKLGWVKEDEIKFLEEEE